MMDDVNIEVVNPSGFPPPTHDTPKARVARAMAPGFGYCGRCGMPWTRVEGHSTTYGEGHGCFPLCEGCWSVLGHPEARIPYYDALVRTWKRIGSPVTDDRRRDIGRAVAAGL